MPWKIHNARACFVNLLNVCHQLKLSFSVIFPLYGDVLLRKSSKLTPHEKHEKWRCAPQTSLAVADAGGSRGMAGPDKLHVITKLSMHT